jgi:integrase
LSQIRGPVQLAVHTGLRLSEEYGLKWDCVDFDRRTLIIPLSKNGELRYVPLNDEAVSALQAAKSDGVPRVVRG